MSTIRSVAGKTILFMLGVVLCCPSSATAHCDGVDGPVVKAAQQALATGDVNLVLIWVQKDDEKEIRQAFDRTVAVRELSTEAKDLADKYFFETLVRIHRTGEGAAYTGLKPAGRDLGPAIPIADRVLITGTVGPLVSLVTEATLMGLTERFHRAVKAREYSTSDIEAGREYVQAYVAFLHYAEHAYEAASQPLGGHLHTDQHSLERHDE